MGYDIRRCKFEKKTDKSLIGATKYYYEYIKEDRVD